jgi:hypothetical protein
VSIKHKKYRVNHEESKFSQTVRILREKFYNISSWSCNFFVILAHEAVKSFVILAPGAVFTRLEHTCVEPITELYHKDRLPNLPEINRLGWK